MRGRADGWEPRTRRGQGARRPRDSVSVDVEFWRKRKSMEGVSVRSVVLNVGIQTVVFLYLLDNDTSYMILISTGIGVLIETWKIQRALIVKVCDAAAWGPLPRRTGQEGRAPLERDAATAYQRLR